MQREREKLDQEQKMAAEREQIRAAAAAAVDRERRLIWEQRHEQDYRRQQQQQQQHAEQLLQKQRRDRETILHLESPASTSVDAVNQHFQESFLRLGLPPTQKVRKQIFKYHHCMLNFRTIFSAERATWFITVI